MIHANCESCILFSKAFRFQFPAIEFRENFCRSYFNNSIIYSKLCRTWNWPILETVVVSQEARETNAKINRLFGLYFFLQFANNVTPHYVVFCLYISLVRNDTPIHSIRFDYYWLKWLSISIYCKRLLSIMMPSKNTIHQSLWAHFWLVHSNEYKFKHMFHLLTA